VGLCQNATTGIVCRAEFFVPVSGLMHHAMHWRTEQLQTSFTSARFLPTNNGNRGANNSSALLRRYRTLARRQELAAGGATNRKEGPKHKRGGTLLQYNIGCMQQPVQQQKAMQPWISFFCRLQGFQRQTCQRRQRENMTLNHMLVIDFKTGNVEEEIRMKRSRMTV